MIMSRQQVLRVYRHLLRQIQLLPKEHERTAAWTEAYSRFRSHALETDPPRIAGLLREAEQKLNYLRMVTPRLKGGRIRAQSPPGTADAPREANNPRRRYVMRDGELVEGSAVAQDRAGVSNWREGNPDPAAVRKHWQLFRKQVKLGL